MTPVSQTGSELGQVGLPYWLFWFLLCVILLLVAVIFLRDKNLRRRMSLFLSGARRRMLQLRLQGKLRKEREKKTALWRELGKRAWSQDIRAEAVDEDRAKLATLEDDLHMHQKTWHDIYASVEALDRQHEAALKRLAGLVREAEEKKAPCREELAALLIRREEVLTAVARATAGIEAESREIREGERRARAAEEDVRLSAPDKASRLTEISAKSGAAAARIKEFEAGLPVLHERRAALDGDVDAAEAKVRAFDAEIRRLEDERVGLERAHERESAEWRKSQQRVQDAIVEVRRLMEPVFESMGHRLDEARLEADDLSLIYFQIDAVDRSMADLQERIERLR